MSEHEAQLESNLVFVTWPYLRELVDSLGMRSAVPIPVAPLLIG